MKLQSLMLRNSLFILAAILAWPVLRAAAQSQPHGSASSAQAAAVPARVTQAIDETQLVRLQGRVHPLARPQFDKGIVPDAMPAKRILLMLKRSMEQESALTQLLSEQQNASSPNYHKWLTPEQFGAKFGPADSDIRIVVSWLESHGFQVAKVSKGKIAIEFSGTAGQLRQAFHTDIHKFLVNGEVHFANANLPQIPAALAPVVRGLAPLNNFRPKPAHHVAGQFTKTIGSTAVNSLKPDFNTGGGSFAIGPTDFATIYNVLPLWNATPAAIDGTGQSIAIIGVSNINPQDVTDFRTVFGLPTGGAANAPIVVIDGDDPGIVNDGSETEALLDVEWSGAVAKGAQIRLYIADDADLPLGSGLFLALFRAIDDNKDPILSLSFGDCELNEGTRNSFWEFFWEPASAQGITITVATGDNGSAGCDNPNAPAPNPAKQGLQVNGLASTPYTVAVGGTDFNDAGTQNTYFGATNDPTTLVSALGYIPESTWNDSCTNLFFGIDPETNCNSAVPANQAAVITVGGSGGASSIYPKPAYQSFISAANGMPADGARDLPDVSLFASDGFNKSFYAVCQADFQGPPPIDPTKSCKKGQPFQFIGVGGTSASTPSFAGIMALVNQVNGRQGNANFVLYKLAQMQYAAATACNSVASPLPAAACTFNDVTAGTISMPCTKGTPDCNTAVGTDTIGVLNGYDSTAGYDLATGLGSVNAANLVNNWSTAVTSFTPTTTTLSLSPTTGITAGQDMTVSGMVTPGSGSAIPTGDFQLVANSPTGGGGLDVFPLDPSGQVVGGSTTSLLSGGTYQVTARYSGDGIFAPSVSAPVTVTVGKAASATVGKVEISSGGGNYLPFATGQGPVTLFLRADMGPATINPNGNAVPTGTVTFMDTFNGATTAVASNVPVSSQPEAFTLPGISTFVVGSHSIVANYSGDASYNTSSSAPVAFTIVGSPTVTTVTSSASSIKAGDSVKLTATVTTTSNGAGPTGTVQFSNGTTTLSAPATCTPTAGAGAATAFCTATLTTTALSFLTPPIAPPQMPPFRTEPIWIALCALMLIYALSLKRLPMAKRLGYACVGLLLMACVAAGIAGCSGPAAPPSHTDSITAVYSGDTTFSQSTSAALPITVTPLK